MDAALITTCRWCHDEPEIRQVEVLVGALPGRVATVLIDAHPHPDGRVVQLQDGSFRLLGDVRYRKRGIDAYRVHGEHSEDCRRSLASFRKNRPR